MQWAPLQHTLVTRTEPLSLDFLLAYLRWVFSLFEAGHPGPRAGLCWNRLRRLSLRFDALIARYRAGTLRPECPGRQRPFNPAPPPGPRSTAAANSKGGFPLSLIPPEQRRPAAIEARFGWLWRAVGSRANTPRCWLEQHLANPEIQALIEAAPGQARRVLRPFCHVLGVTPPAALALPPRPRRPRKPSPEKSVRPRPPRPVSPSGRYVRIDGRRIPREWLPGSPLRPPIKPV